MHCKILVGQAPLVALLLLVILSFSESYFRLSVAKGDDPAPMKAAANFLGLPPPGGSRGGTFMIFGGGGCSAGEVCGCGRDAGGRASDLRSPMSPSRVNNCSAPWKRAPAAEPLQSLPVTPKVRMPEALPAMYFSTRAWSGWSGRPA